MIHLRAAWVSRTARSSVSAPIAILGLPIVIAAQTAASHIHAGISRESPAAGHLDVEDLTAGTPLSAVHANLLAMKRMPGVRHHDKLRSVC